MKLHKRILTRMPGPVLLPPEARNTVSHLAQKQLAQMTDLNRALRPCCSPSILLGLGLGPKSRGNSAIY